MQHITSPTEYQQIVDDIATEFAGEISTGAHRSLANSLLPHVRMDDSTPVVLDFVEYEGGPVESINACLAPYDVLQYTDAAIANNQEPNNIELAATALAIDLTHAVS